MRFTQADGIRIAIAPDSCEVRPETPDADRPERLVAEQVSAAEVSAIKQMAMRAAAMNDVASLAWGLPSFSTPRVIRTRVAEQLSTDPDIGKYTLPDGLPALRELAAHRYQQETGYAADPNTQVMITAGNMQALSTLLHVVLNPGDEVILTDPGFASHYQQIGLHLGKPVPWRLIEQTGWQLDLDALPGLITPRTKALILVNPSNPTGTLFSPDDLRALTSILRAHSLLLIIDDPYSGFVYTDDTAPYNPAADPQIVDRAAYCFTFSKCFAMSGWRLGYMVLPPWLKQQAMKVHDANLICAPRIAQVAGIAALSQPADHLAEYRAILRKRRDLMLARLDQLPGVFDYTTPQGAYYVFPRIRVAHRDARTFCLKLLDQARVSLTPGDAFGAAGEHHVRMAYCVDEETINLAFDRMEAHFLSPSRGASARDSTNRPVR